MGLAHRESHREGCAILVATFHLAANADDLALARAAVVFQVAIVLSVERRWHQHLDVAAHDLILPIAEQLLTSWIEHSDISKRIDQNDPVDRSVEHRPELLGALVQGHPVARISLGLRHAPFWISEHSTWRPFVHQCSPRPGMAHSTNERLWIINHQLFFWQLPVLSPDISPYKDIIPSS